MFLAAILALMLAPPFVPPAPPADVDTLIAAAPADAAAAKRMLSENGVPAARRLEALALLAKQQSRSRAAVAMDFIAECAGACGGTRDMADVLVDLHDEVAADSALLARAVATAGDQSLPEAVRMASYRTVCAIPADKRPDAAKTFAVRTVALKTVPGAMQYDVKEVRARPHEALHFVLENTDSMQHNLLLVLPGKLTEAGVAGDKMGETAAGKAKHFIPDAPIVLAVMGLIDPGKTGHLYFFAPAKPATYPYVCTYPAHWRMMNGKLKVAGDD